MKISTIYLLALASAVILLGVWYYTNVVTHERVHQLILADYGIDSDVKYNFKGFSNDSWVGITSPTNSTEYFNKCNAYCQLANEMNEVVGYNFAILISVILVMFIIYLSVNTIKYSELELQEVMQC